MQTLGIEKSYSTSDIRKQIESKRFKASQQFRLCMDQRIGKMTEELLGYVQT